jgi:hypothetical protein
MSGLARTCKFTGDRVGVNHATAKIAHHSGYGAFAAANSAS